MKRIPNWIWLNGRPHRHKWWPELYGQSCTCGAKIVVPGCEDRLP